MHNVILILLHRPFVSDGHLHSNPSNAVNSFMVCATAARAIVSILRAYDRAFSIQRAPYLISYATYVSATIHVRIAAQRESGSEAHACLATCLDVFKKNQETNWAVRRANVIIQNLMKRMQVVITEDESDAVDPPAGGVGGMTDKNNVPGPMMNENSSGNSNNDPNTSVLTGSGGGEVASNLNIDAIIQSFIREQQTSEPLLPPQHQIRNDSTVAYYPLGGAGGGLHQWFHPSTSTSSFGIPPDNMPYDATSLAYGPAFDQQQDATMPMEYSVNDMLFGFNSSAMEGIGWEFDDRSL
jgi:hypothetical protein